MSTVKMYIIYVVLHEKAKNEPFKCILLIKTWDYSNNSSIFAMLEPAKPLNDAQMCGSFFNII